MKRIIRAVVVPFLLLAPAAAAQDFNLFALRGNVAEVEFLWHLPTGELREIALRIWSEDAINAPAQVAPLRVQCTGAAGPACTNVEFWLTSSQFPAPSGPCTKTAYFTFEPGNMRRDRWRCAEPVRKDHGKCVYVDGWLLARDNLGVQGLSIVSDYVVPDGFCSEKP